MLLTISTTHQPATDLGWLLHKHPEKIQSFDLSAGKAHIFYPKATKEECTAALILDIDSIDLVRKLKVPGKNLMLQHYVNDRPYTASSFMSVAISKVYSSALNGKCKDRPELLNQAWPFCVKLSAVKVSGGETAIRKIFEPLGYEIIVEEQVLDAEFPEWGTSPYFTIDLKNNISLEDLLTHLYILLSVFDKERHYWVSQNEVDKLLEKGDKWLSTHPEKEFIVRRYLKNIGVLARDAMERLEQDSVKETEGESEVKKKQEERRQGLHQVRLEAAKEALKKAGATTVVDLGCGEGKLLRLLLKERQFKKILGMDVSMRSLQIAKERLYLDNMAPKQKERIELIQGSLTYKDDRLKGFDAAAIIEVIEHLEPERLQAFERVVFEQARPEIIVLTTPNSEYNALYEFLPEGQFRHDDHRFEWSRSEFMEWTNDICERYGYTVEMSGVGEEGEKVGCPSQMAVFTIKEID